MLEGGQRHEAFSYPDAEYYYYLAADKFGWTPSQVDEQPAILMDYIMAIAQAVDEVRSKKLNDS